MNYRREIDGLRAVAVLPVIFFHAGISTISGGFVGVDVFFVISGYLITSIIFAEREAGNFSLIGFYERRARRILPALFVVMFVCIPLAWFLLMPKDMQAFSQSLMAVPTFVSNILFARQINYFDTSAELKPLLHTWSLAVEEQFYLLFPLFVMLTWRICKLHVVWMLLVISCISFYAAQWGSSLFRSSSIFYILPTRAWELLIGAIAAIYMFERDKKRNFQWKEINGFAKQFAGVLGLFLILYGVFAYDKKTPFPGVYALAPTVGAVLIILFATQKTIVGRMLGSNIFVGIGLVSYSAYLWHQPIFAFAKHRAMGEPTKEVMLSLLLLVLLLAYISWRYIEKPFRSKHLIGRAKIFLLGGSLSVLFFTGGLIGYLQDGYPSRFDDRVLTAIRGFDDKSPRQKECHATPYKYIHPTEACLIGNNSRIVGALLGDSHADAISYALDMALGDRHVGMKHMSYTGCPPVVEVYLVDGGDMHKCNEYNNEVLNYLANQKDYKLVVLVARWTLYASGSGFDNEEGGIEDANHWSDVYVDGKKASNSNPIRLDLLKRRYADGVREHLRIGKKVVLVYPIPEAGWHVPTYMVKKAVFEHPIENNTDLSTSYDVFKKRNKEIIEALDSIGENKNLVRIRPDKILCDSFVRERCVVQLNGVPLYYDDDHLSNVGAKLIADEILKAIETNL